MADDGEGPARLRVQAQIMQHNASRHIAESHMTRFHIAVNVPQRESAGHVRRLLRLVQQGENALRRRKSGIEFVDDVRNLVDRAAELSRVKYERGNQMCIRDRLYFVLSIF